MDLACDGAAWCPAYASAQPGRSLQLLQRRGLEPGLRSWLPSIGAPEVAALLGDSQPDWALAVVSQLQSRLTTCSSVARCSLYWYLLLTCCGPLGRAFEATSLESAWSQQYRNFSWRARASWNARLRRLQLELRRQISGGDLASNFSLEAARASQAVLPTILLFGDRLEYFDEPHVAPFVGQLRCYALRQNMQLHLDSNGSRVLHRRLAKFGDHVWAARGTVDATLVETLGVATRALLDGDLKGVEAIDNFSDYIGVTQDDPAKFGRVWAIAERLAVAKFVVHAVVHRPEERAERPGRDDP
eukprot:TRINITY_DN11244_c0_g1_i2.p1 TRINITY_DN11244_c0_g1~~TRINITY_DN11244_c0_g1_i2.p1  ORF type:complete len:301 (+),score=39.37 TRINITY_DN11244_c0_g1_i2:478-1380(+)